MLKQWNKTGRAVRRTIRKLYKNSWIVVYFSGIVLLLSVSASYLLPFLSYLNSASATKTASAISWALLLAICLYFMKEIAVLSESLVSTNATRAIRQGSLKSLLRSPSVQFKFLKFVFSVSFIVIATYFVQLYLITDQYTTRLSLWLTHLEYVDGNVLGLSITNNSGVRVRLYFHECNGLLFYHLKSQEEWRAFPNKPRCLASRILCEELNIVRPLRHLNEYSFFDFNNTYMEPYTSGHLTFVMLDDNAECLVDVYPPDGYLVSFDSLYIDPDDFNKFNYKITGPIKTSYYPAIWRYRFYITRLKEDQR